MAESGNTGKISLTIKTAKDKQLVDINENASIKDVSFS